MVEEVRREDTELIHGFLLPNRDSFPGTIHLARNTFRE